MKLTIDFGDNTYTYEKTISIISPFAKIVIPSLVSVYVIQVITMLYLMTFIARPFLSLYRIFAYNGQLTDAWLFNLMFGSLHMLYFNFAPLILVSILLVAGIFLTKAKPVRASRWFTVPLGAAIALLVSTSVQMLDVVFKASATNNMPYVFVHAASYIVAIGFFIYFIEITKRENARR